MRRLIPALVVPLLIAAPTIQIVRTSISDTDGGPPNPVNADYRPGDSLYFVAHVAGFAKDPNDQVKLSYSVSALDGHNVPLAEPYKNTLNAEVAPQDKDWQPKIATSVSLPLFLFPGEYKVLVKTDDLVAKSSVEAAVPFRVRVTEAVHPSDSLSIQAFRFLRREDDAKPAERAAYVPGDHLWAKFDIAGFRYGPGNKIDVTYLTSVLSAEGKTLWTQPQPEGVANESFYPPAYVPAEMGIELQPKIKPGDYTLVVTAKDAIGNQTVEERHTFSIVQ